MKYLLGLLGVVLASTGVWAAEQMTMYATLSMPVASFWTVETTSNEPIVIGADQPVLNLWAGTNTGKGDIKVTDPSNFYVQTLKMEGDTTFEVGESKKWYVDSLTLGNQGQATFKGDLMAKTLQLSSTNEIEVSNKLVFGTSFDTPVTVSEAQFGNVTLIHSSENAKDTFHFDAENLTLSGTSCEITAENKKVCITLAP